MRPLVLIALLLAAQAAAAAEPGMGTGGCEDYTWDMKRELFLLGTGALDFTALPERTEGARYTPLDRPLQVALPSASAVKLLVEPGRAHDAAATYAGLMRLAVPRTSTYRISSDQRLWIDVIGPEGVVKSSKFVMQTGCEKLVKSVAFRLEPDTSYWIQVTGSPVRAPMLLITLDR